MQTRFKKGAKVFDIIITAVAGMLSVGMMLYGIGHFGLGEAWPQDYRVGHGKLLKTI